MASPSGQTAARDADDPGARQRSVYFGQPGAVPRADRALSASSRAYPSHLSSLIPWCPARGFYGICRTVHTGSNPSVALGTAGVIALQMAYRASRVLEVFSWRHAKWQKSTSSIEITATGSPAHASHWLRMSHLYMITNTDEFFNPHAPPLLWVEGHPLQRQVAGIAPLME